MNNKPLFLRFAIPGNRFFIYDTLKNLFFEVDNAIYDIMEYYRLSSEKEIIEKLSQKYPREKLESSLKLIKEQEEKRGVFSKYRAPTMSFSHDGEPPFHKGYKANCSQLILEVTQRCNFRCKYCVFSGHYAYQRTHKKTDMTWKTAKAAIDWFLRSSKKTEERAITFYGGEPLLKFDMIKKVIEYVKKKKLDVHYSFTTNGYLLGSRKIADFLAKNDIAIQISLDGPKDIHDKFRVTAGDKPTHDVIIKNLKKLHELHPEYYSKRVGCIVTLAYNSDFPKIYGFFKKDHGFPLKLQSVADVEAMDTDFYEIYGNNKEDENTLAPLFQEYCDNIEKNALAPTSVPAKNDPGIEILKTLFNSMFLHIHRRCSKKHTNMHMNGCCIPGQRRAFVQVNGNMHACERIGDKYPIGNVHKKGLDLKKIRSFIKAYVDLSVDDCRECPIQNICKLCFKAAMQNGVMTTQRKREQCKEHIAEITRDMYKYLLIKTKNKDAFKFLDEIDVG